MSYELRKILGNRYVMLLLALAVAVNAALFYRRCTKDLGGFTRADVQAGGTVAVGARVDFVPEGLEATQIMAMDSRAPRIGIQPSTTPAPSRISQLIQKCWRRRRPLNENMALAKS